MALKGREGGQTVGEGFQPATLKVDLQQATFANLWLIILLMSV